MRGPCSPDQSHPGYVELQQIFSSNHLQESHKDGSRLLQNDHPQTRREADAVLSIQNIRKNNPLLVGILEGNELTLQRLTAKMSNSAAAAAQGHSTTRCSHFQSNIRNSSLGTHPSASKSSAADMDRLPLTVPIYRTNAEILELINEKIASFQARRLRPDNSRPNITSIPFHSRTFPSDKKDATVHSLSCSLTRQNIATGQAFKAGKLKDTQENAQLTPRSNKMVNVSAAMRHSKGITSSSVELCPNVSIDKRVMAGLELPKQTCDGSKFACDVQTSSSGKVSNKHVGTAVSLKCVTHYSLSALKDLAASLDDAATNAKMDNFSEVLLQKYWDGDKDNIGVFASTEYPKIMLEVAATCARHEEESPVVVAALSTNLSLNSHLPLKDQCSWMNIGEKMPGQDPASEVSSIPKHQVAKDQRKTSLKPADTDNIQSVTSLSVCPQHLRKQGTNAMKQKNTKGMQGSKVTSKEVTSNSIQNFSLQNISCENVRLAVNAGEEQRLSHSSSHSVGGTATNHQEVSSSQKGTFSLNVLKVPQYEDVSDADDAAQKVSQFSASLEDISGDENIQTANVVWETPVPLTEGSVLKRKSHGPMKSRLHPKLIPEPPQNCSCPYYVETETGFEHVLCPKCDHERLLRLQTIGSRSPSIVVKRQEESDNDVADRIVIPLDVTDVGSNGQVEPEDTNLEEQIVTSSPVSVRPLLATVDITQGTSTQGQSAQPGNCAPIPPEGCMPGMDTDNPQSTGQSSCESDDSCETEDSCDYVHTQGTNYMTVSRQAWKNRSEQGDKRTRQKAFTKRDKSNLNPDMKDEIEDSGTKMTKKEQKVISSHSKDSRASSHHHKRQFKQHPRPKSQVEQTTKIQGASSEPPQIEKKNQDLKPMNAEALIGPAQPMTNRLTTAKEDHAASKVKLKDKKTKTRRAARIYSDSSETEADVDRMKSDKVEKTNIHKKAKTAQLSETEDSEESTSNSPDCSPPQKQSKTFTSPKKTPDKPPQNADTTSQLSGRSIVNRLYIQESHQSNNCLKLSKQFPVQSKGADGQPASTYTATVKMADSSKGRKPHWNSDKSRRLPVLKPKSSSGSHAAVQSPNRKPSTSEPKQHLPASRQHLLCSFSHPPTSDHSCPSRENHSSPKSVHSSAWDKVKDIWKDGFYPVPVHKKASHGTENDICPTTELEPGPSSSSQVHKRRHSSCKSETPLMKKTKSEAKERTRDINHNPKRQRSHAVADHYKWKNRGGRETEGSWRRRAICPSSPELDWD